MTSNKEFSENLRFPADRKIYSYDKNTLIGVDKTSTCDSSSSPYDTPPPPPSHQTRRHQRHHQCCSLNILLRSERCTEGTAGVCFPDLGGLYSAPGNRPAIQPMVVTVIKRGQRFEIGRTTLNQISEGNLRGN